MYRRVHRTDPGSERPERLAFGLPFEPHRSTALREPSENVDFGHSPPPTEDRDVSLAQHVENDLAKCAGCTLGELHPYRGAHDDRAAPRIAGRAEVSRIMPFLLRLPDVPQAQVAIDAIRRRPERLPENEREWLEGPAP